MSILEKALAMLEKHSLCDHCLGRQFAMLGTGLQNDERGKAIKLALALEAQALTASKPEESVKKLKVLAVNGFSENAKQVLRKMNKRIPEKAVSKSCFLCENRFENAEDLTRKALPFLKDYEYNTFLVGTELPTKVEEREDEFKAEFEINYGEDLRNEFGRTVGRKIAEATNKEVDFKKPEVVVLVNPFSEEIRLQVNPLYVAGRYKKLVRGIPQSKWFCSNCHGKGCEKCGWTGKMYPESVEEIIGKPVLDATKGAKTSFHGSGREDIDARMLGNGRPFAIEITRPKRRFLDLTKLEKAINKHGKGKVEVSGLKAANKDVVRELKKSESKQKEYHVLMEFEKRIADKDLRLLKKKLTNAAIAQKTPSRVMHRRADLTREKYIYEVNIKKLAPKRAEMKIRCQGGLYVKELVSGDEGRTTPSVTEILKNKAKPLKLDVLNIIMGD
ncbi:MAG TPA: tRNA pseudouridine(54/55) synthase Pus10 [Candidatus Acidoferrum sp.]|jgi:tRNA pseudouridine synthase 10|nr:tRNA pseudouridine(54/55) synthase Pus10 [Candidatus Acidoferrum sp.]